MCKSHPRETLPQVVRLHVTANVYVVNHVHIRCCLFVLQVLAKFLGLLTFCPNWGISASDAASTRNESPLANANEEVSHEGRHSLSSCWPTIKYSSILRRV